MEIETVAWWLLITTPDPYIGIEAPVSTNFQVDLSIAVNEIHCKLMAARLESANCFRATIEQGMEFFRSLWESLDNMKEIEASKDI